MMKFKRLLVANAVLLAGAFAASAQADDSLVKQGEYISRLGDCGACHTVPGKPAFSGGLAIESSLGTIYSTNITPDKQQDRKSVV